MEKRKGVNASETTGCAVGDLGQPRRKKPSGRRRRRGQKARRKMGKPWETAGRKAEGAKARKRYAGQAANYEKQTTGNHGTQSHGG